MQQENTPKAVIGRAERVALPEYRLKAVPAKIDSGADTSSIWASDIVEHEDRLSFKLFGTGSPYYTGQIITCEPDDYTVTRVASSFGHREMRFAIKLVVNVKGRRIRGTFTLADRANKTYPILLGRKLLHGKFLIDVAKGHALKDLEKQKKDAMRQEIDNLRSQSI